MRYNVWAKVRRVSGEKLPDVEYRVEAENMKVAEDKVLVQLLDTLGDGHYRIEYETAEVLST